MKLFLQRSVNDNIIIKLLFIVLIFFISTISTVAQQVFFEGVTSGAVDCADYNNDGFVDVLLVGASIHQTTNGGYKSITKLYKNNGNGTFTEQTQIYLTKVQNGSIAWGDYNNDNYIDILLTGKSDNGLISKLYKNNGDETFTEQVSINLTGVSSSSVAWGDYNNDNNLDILLTGMSSAGQVSKIYKNNGDETFAEQVSINLTGVSSSSVAWGDYNNDNNLDILLTGSGVGNIRTSKLYKNNGDETFTEQTSISLIGVIGSSVAWGDYNNDSYLDILLTGIDNSSNSISKVYKNNGDETFIEQTPTNFKNVGYSSVAWRDFNNDNNLDILLSGEVDSYSFISAIYYNRGQEPFFNPTMFDPINNFSQVDNLILSEKIDLGDYNNDNSYDILEKDNIYTNYKGYFKEKKDINIFGQ